MPRSSRGAKRQTARKISLGLVFRKTEDCLIGLLSEEWPTRSEELDVAWMTSVEYAIRDNKGIPVMFTVEATRLLTDNMTGITEASVYFEDDPMTGITIPKVRKAAAELPIGQMKNQEWSGFTQASVKE